MKHPEAIPRSRYALTQRSFAFAVVDPFADRRVNDPANQSAQRAFNTAAPFSQWHTDCRQHGGGPVVAISMGARAPAAGLGAANSVVAKAATTASTLARSLVQC